MMEKVFGIKLLIDIFNYIKKITSQKMLFILLILTMIWFISAMCKIINYHSKIPLINVIHGISNLTDGKKQYKQVREDCGLTHTILLSGFIQKMNKYQKMDKSICFEYDFLCKGLVNIFLNKETVNNYGFTFLTMSGLNDDDRYNVKRTVILNDKKSNYFIKSLIDKSLNNKDEFIYFTRKQVVRECPEFEKTMFGFSTTKNQNQVSFLLEKSSLVGENDDAESYMFVAFVNENEVENIQCKTDRSLKDLLSTVINNSYTNSFVK